MDLIDPESLDWFTLSSIRQLDCKVQLVFTWIQSLVVDANNARILAIPAPVLSRAFHELSQGMQAYHECLKISHTPFPRPYSQAATMALCLHILVAPFVTVQTMKHPMMAAIVCWLQVFILWILHFAALESENPFGTDPNDFDTESMQKQFNRELLMLLMHRVSPMPRFKKEDSKLDLSALLGASRCNLHQAWRKGGRSAMHLSLAPESTFFSMHPATTYVSKCQKPSKQILEQSPSQLSIGRESGAQAPCPRANQPVQLWRPTTCDLEMKYMPEASSFSRGSTPSVYAPEICKRSYGADDLDRASALASSHIEASDECWGTDEHPSIGPSLEQIIENLNDTANLSDADKVDGDERTTLRPSMIRLGMDLSKAEVVGLSRGTTSIRRSARDALPTSL
jgi:hypothetical protein